MYLHLVPVFSNESGLIIEKNMLSYLKLNCFTTIKLSCQVSYQ